MGQPVVPFEVPDVEAALAKAGITLGQFLDPEGNVVGLTQSAS